MSLSISLVLFGFSGFGLFSHFQQNTFCGATVFPSKESMPRTCTRTHTIAKQTGRPSTLIMNRRELYFFFCILYLKLHNSPHRINNDFDLFLFFGQLFAVKICVLVVFDVMMLRCCRSVTGAGFALFAGLAFIIVPACPSVFAPLSNV